MDEANELLTEKRGRIGVLTFNRPERRNALSPRLLIALHEKLEAWAGEDELRGGDRDEALQTVRGAIVHRHRMLPRLPGAVHPQRQRDATAVTGRRDSGNPGSHIVTSLSDGSDLQHEDALDLCLGYVWAPGERQADLRAIVHLH